MSKRKPATQPHPYQPRDLSDGRIRAPREWAIDLATLLVLAVVVFGTYFSVRNTPFIYDDAISITSNKSLRQLWPAIGDAEHPGPLNPARNLPTSGRPLVNLSLAINYHFGQLDPSGYRAFNIALHVLSAMVLMLIVRRTLLLPYFGGSFESSAKLLAATTALIWAVHPLQTEAVAYVTQRTELLMAFFYLGTLFSSLRYWSADTRLGQAIWLAIATLACAAGMASKEVMVTAPAVVLLFEWVFVDRRLLEIGCRSWRLYACLSATWLVLIYLNLGGPRSASAGFGLEMSPIVWWMTQAKFLWMYLKLSVWPWPLVIHYDVPYLRNFATSWPWLLLTVVFVTATLLLLWRRRAAGFVGAAVLLVLSPTLLVPIPSEMAAERRMYLPLAAIVALLVAGSYSLMQRFLARRSELSSSWQLASGAAAALLVAVAFGSVSAHRLEAYQDSASLWKDALNHQPDSFTANYNLASCLVAGGHNAEAVPYLEQAIKLKPNVWKAHNQLGVALNSLGRKAEARQCFERAVELEPGSVANLLSLGTFLLDNGHADEALQMFNEAARLDATDFRPHLALGVALSKLGELKDSMRYFEQAVELASGQAEVRSSYGMALAKLGHTETALEQFRMAVELEPDHATTQLNLGLALFQANDFQGATEHLEQAIRLQPDDFAVYAKLAEAYLRTNQTERSIAVAEQAAALARSAGQLAAASQVDAWIAELRAQESGTSTGRPASVPADKQ